MCSPGNVLWKQSIKGNLKKKTKALRVSFSKMTKCHHKLSSSMSWFRTVSGSGRSCLEELQIVHLPDTVGLRHEAFRGCCVLRAVTAPGCKLFGIKVFEACCSLTQIGTTQHSDNPKQNFGFERLKGGRPCVRDHVQPGRPRIPGQIAKAFSFMDSSPFVPVDSNGMESGR